MYFNDFGSDPLTAASFRAKIAPLQKGITVWAIANGLNKRTSVLSGSGQFTGAWAAFNSYSFIKEFIQSYESTMRAVAKGGAVTGQGLTEAELKVLGSFIEVPDTTSLKGAFLPNGLAADGTWTQGGVCKADGMGAPAAEGPCSDINGVVNQDCVKYYNANANKVCYAATKRTFVPKTSALTQYANDAIAIALIQKALGINTQVTGGGVSVSTSVASAAGGWGKWLAGLAVLGLGVVVFKGRR